MITTTTATTSEQEAFTAAISKALVSLKKGAGLKSIRQNYKGTGTQRARRQLWIYLTDGRAVDVWLEADRYTIGGVNATRIPGTWHYGDWPPAAIASALAAQLATLTR
jgi:hypothetical protein